MTAPHIKHTAVRIAVSAAFLLSCLFIKQTAAAVGAAVSMCIGQLIPSLYVFLILANLYPPITVSHPEKRLPRGFFGTLLLTVTGGFPIGAVCVRRAYQNGQISLRTAKRLSLVMCCCGPGFLVNFVGGSLCGSTAAGWLMFAAQILTLLPEVWFALLRTDPPERNQTKIFVSSGLSESLLAAAKSMANICTVVILFYAVNGMLSPLLIRIPPVCRELILGLIEVTAGCGTLHSVSGMTRLCLACLFLRIRRTMRPYTDLRNFKGMRAARRPFYCGAAVSRVHTNRRLLSACKGHRTDAAPVRRQLHRRESGYPCGKQHDLANHDAAACLFYAAFLRSLRRKTARRGKIQIQEILETV